MLKNQELIRYMEMTNERFSIFPTGWWDEVKQKATPRQRPQQTQTISWVYDYIISERARKATEDFRAMAPNASREEKQTFKTLNFEYATFSGIFSYRNARSLVSRTPFLTIDIDHLNSEKETKELKRILVHDQRIETALCFVSPSGRGIKWIVRLPEWTVGLSFKEQFEQVRQYVGFTYGVDPDKSGSDVCRACFLPYDFECFINIKKIQHETTKTIQ